MRRIRIISGGLFLSLFVCGFASAAKPVFTPQELFRVSFGKAREQLAARVENGKFIIPRDFTMDATGHFYIYDPNNHRIVRFSSEGKFEMDFRYLETARQVFAHPDARENLWLLISDPAQGLYYGVYNSRGKNERAGIFAQFNHFRLHMDDNGTLHVLLSSEKHPGDEQSYLFDQETLLMKKENVARPPETHHEIRRSDHVYFIDQMPDASKEDARHVNRITDEAHHNVADIKGTVVYVTDSGEIYTRVGEREILVYGMNGSLMGKVTLTGLSSACASIRFDSAGNLYELDGIPDAGGQYSTDMPGMRLICWKHP